ncbi:MAG: hypothetical protein WBD45_25435 [Terriglobales bacterium]
MADEAVLDTPVVDAPVVSAPEVTAPAPEVSQTPEAQAERLNAAVGASMDKTPGFEVTKPAEVVKTPEQLATEKAAADKVIADKAAADKATADAAKTPEQIATEKAAADKVIADKAAADAAKVVVENPLDKLGALPAELLAKAITDNPALAAELAKSGIDSELLFDTARQAALTEQYQEVFPTPEAAKYAGESAQHFYDIEEGFPKIQNVTDFDSFLTKTMLPLSVLYDEKGAPLMTPDGKGYQTDGSIERFLTSAVQHDTISAVKWVDHLIAEAKATPGEAGEERLAEAERVKEAFSIVMAFRDNGGKLGAKEAAPQRSAADQLLIDQAQKDRTEAAKVRTEATQKAAEAFQSSITTDFEAAGKSFVESTLNQSSLNDNEKGFIAEKATNATLDAMAANKHYQQLKNHYYSLGQSAETKAAINTLANNQFKQTAGKILGDLIEKAGGKMISRQQQREAKQSTQIQNDKMNQGQGTTPGAKAAPVLTSSETRAKAIANFKAANKGEMPDDSQILNETLKIRGF